MKWILDRSAGTLRYWTLAGDKKVAELKYNTESNSMRLDTADKRLFFLEQARFFQTKVILKTEYNVVAGENHYNRSSKKGFLLINGQKIPYQVRDSHLYLFNRRTMVAEQCLIEELNELDPFEFSALLFGFNRIFERAYKLSPASAGDSSAEIGSEVRW